MKLILSRRDNLLVEKIPNQNTKSRRDDLSITISGLQNGRPDGAL